MRKILFPLLLVACTEDEATQPEVPKTQKATLNLKVACDSSKLYSLDTLPESWDATIRWTGKDSTLHVDQVNLNYTSRGFELPCGYGVEGDPKPTLVITYTL